ncbi:hypothetical protein [Methylobacterium sp. UNC300MFChir4.1]|uniref:hypothetical protein n=1 Tax=Methylobacterium sp. UNC300MFChir4.1 TaxID=1502747 RepID=UPI001113FDC3|nr:hypothetical protein [Methylobacterium sp. UNC300MFChir4.1]
MVRITEALENLTHENKSIDLGMFEYIDSGQDKLFFGSRLGLRGACETASRVTTAEIAEGIDII